MTHFLIIQIFIFYSWDSWKRLPQSIFARYIILLLMIWAFTGAAIFFYRYIEEPANRQLRCLLGKFKQSDPQMIGG
jgi:peptidoglycan/LPS O-acetylase OafA/YrhL